MRVLIACEHSGIVRDAFKRRGHEAWSCDLLPTERPGLHYQGDVFDILKEKWDLLIAHPPCTHLAISGALWFHLKEKEQREAINFARRLIFAPIPKVVVENPMGILSTRVAKYSQVIHPWMFGHDKAKTTCLWLRGVPKLQPTKIIPPRGYQLVTAKIDCVQEDGTLSGALYTIIVTRSVVALVPIRRATLIRKYMALSSQ